MKSYGLSPLLLLLHLFYWVHVDGLCQLEKYTAARCHDLEDARYIETYHLHTLIAPSSSKTLEPGNFRNLTSLRHLDLSGGKIETIESGSFAKLRHLQTLNLVDNRINHLDVGAFDGLKHVHSLQLSGNQIKQLPSALLTLKDLRLLDVSNNPLNCNCASMKLRDVLLTRGVKISKKTQCLEPSAFKHMPILKPDTKIVCEFEKQDQEMQGDQPFEDSAEGSGEAEEDEILEEVDKELEEEEARELEQAKNQDEKKETTVLSTSSEDILSSSTVVTQATDVSSESPSSSTVAAKDDITFVDTGAAHKNITIDITSDEVTDSEEIEIGRSNELIYPELVSKQPSTTEDHIDASASSKPEKSDDIIVPDEGSGESDDDGSGSDGSGMIARMPGIDFNETSVGLDEEEVPVLSTSTTTTTTEGSSWWGLGELINIWSPWGSSETPELPHTTEKSAEDSLKEEQFIQVTDQPLSKSTVEDVVIPPKVILQDEASSNQSPRMTNIASDDKMEDTSSDPAFSQEAKKGMGSYVVLAALLAILATLIAFAAYKGDFCRKKRKRRDVERGTEMKDMQRSLLDQKMNPKPQVSNGNTLENVPLMNPSAPPEEPKEGQRSYDISPAVVTNGSSKSNGPSVEINDPVKPPRKGMSQEIEAPLNGLNPPMDAIDGPTTMHNGSAEGLDDESYADRPPLSPGAQRVKITLQENPDSVPKTPLLITRLKGSENLVKAS